MTNKIGRGFSADWWQSCRMEKHALVEGRFYAYRESAALGTPFLKIRLLEKVAGRPKVKIRFETAHTPGLRSMC